MLHMHISSNAANPEEYYDLFSKKSSINALGSTVHCLQLCASRAMEVHLTLHQTERIDCISVQLADPAEQVTEFGIQGSNTGCKIQERQVVNGDCASHTSLQVPG